LHSFWRADKVDHSVFKVPNSSNELDFLKQKWEDDAIQYNSHAHPQVQNMGLAIPRSSWLKLKDHKDLWCHTQVSPHWDVILASLKEYHFLPELSLTPLQPRVVHMRRKNRS